MSLRARVHAGDPVAFRELFDEHARSVYNHAFRLTGDWSTAEDAVSTTFLEAWRLRQTVRVGIGDGSLRPWLLGITTNVVRNIRRAARRHAGALARLPKPEMTPDFADEVALRVDDREQLGLVRAALAALRRPEREVLALCVWSGLDYAAAAEALGVPVGTVRSRLFRTRKKLEKLVEAGRLRPAEKCGEPHVGRGQITGSREIAARFAQENSR
ncbi:RNA polymerase sigma factor [Micromonospora sp. WMMD1102]|uniref:RNA polymerase sigma factor n=1 Tax=Micromonospora sp. WMMD1102 TaxID=3016105 RepID=UPI0024153193|nr:RNA polymerase sigma factor [Micromonospora sp. WMMD1102]MDG4790979.1 RNA polymerase sigma factor [Micromonospora sp. WMMD1102]